MIQLPLRWPLQPSALATRAPPPLATGEGEGSSGHFHRRHAAKHPHHRSRAARAAAAAEHPALSLLRCPRLAAEPLAPPLQRLRRGARSGEGKGGREVGEELRRRGSKGGERERIRWRKRMREFKISVMDITAGS